MNMTHPHAGEHAIESRLAARVAGALTARVQALPHDVTERLRFSRERAVAHAREARRVAPAGILALANGGGAAVLGSLVPWWQRVASVLPLLLLVAGLLVIDQWTDSERVMAAAEVDAQLLSDQLPPAAYSDPGFAEFLRSSQVR